jgi:hypothetical protein
MINFDVETFPHLEAYGPAGLLRVLLLLLMYANSERRTMVTHDEVDLDKGRAKNNSSQTA